MITLTRRYRFSASHRLHTGRLSAEENRKLYGKCNNPYGHGHDYVLEVSARGGIDPETGRALDVPALDRLVRREILEAFDHQNLNLALPETVPTTENLALEVCRRLRQRWRSVFGDNGPELARIRIAETRRNIFELSL